MRAKHTAFPLQLAFLFRRQAISAALAKHSSSFCFAPDTVIRHGFGEQLQLVRGLDT
jgi:hypothetical protein